MGLKINLFFSSVKKKSPDGIYQKIFFEWMKINKHDEKQLILDLLLKTVPRNSPFLFNFFFLHVYNVSAYQIFYSLSLC